MRIKKGLSFISIIILFSSCTSTKLMDSWKSDNFKSLATAKILVISKTPQADVRKSFEVSIADKLRSKNLDAIESHIKFPSLQEANTIEEQNKIVKQFEEAGITAIILTSLKQTIETQNGGAQSVIPKGYEDKRSFNSDAISTETAPVSNSKTYVLEAITYNLILENDDQLVNVCLVDVTDPDSEDKILKTFTKIIGDQFN